MAFVSDIFVWDDELDDQVRIGSIVTDGKKVTVKFPKGTSEDDRQTVRRIAGREITGPDGNLIYPKKDPELFVKNLAVSYGSAWLAATVARKEE